MEVNGVKEKLHKSRITNIELESAHHEGTISIFLVLILFFYGSSCYAIFIFNVRSLKAWNQGLGMVANVVIWILVAIFFKYIIMK
jgi:ABC-type Na+ efflux pump permease subunit